MGCCVKMKLPTCSPIKASTPLTAANTLMNAIKLDMMPKTRVIASIAPFVAASIAELNSLLVLRQK